MVLAEAGRPRLLRVAPTLPEASGSRWLLLGLEYGAPVFGAELPPGIEVPGGEWQGLREAGLALAREEAGLAAALVALTGWHRRVRFCSACGARAEPVQGGGARRCTRCGTLQFPRTDPAVIMLVHDGARVLLGRRAGWPERRFSVLAGFVSPGESLEEAVLREVREEAAVDAVEPRYVASQPWPFPASLMLGFTARYTGGQARPADDELVEVEWLDAGQVQAALNDEGRFRLPPRVSIARQLIEHWWGGLKA